MIVKRFALVVTAGVFSASIASGQDITCNPEGNTMEMGACLQKDFEKADKGLNAVYQKLLKSLSNEDKESGAEGEVTRVARLKDAQRAWVAWRDVECVLRSVGNFGGSIESLNIPACTARLTEERTKLLTGILNGEE